MRVETLLNIRNSANKRHITRATVDFLEPLRLDLNLILEIGQVLNGKELLDVIVNAALLRLLVHSVALLNGWNYVVS